MEEVFDMFSHARRTWTFLILAYIVLVTLSALAHAGPATDDKALAAALRSGGLVIVVRHGATFPNQADSQPFDKDNIAGQRNLNEDGKALAKAFGDSLRQVGVPVGRVYTSQYNRAYETAVLAGFKNIQKTADLNLPEEGMLASANENSRRAEALRKMLAAAPGAGTNTVMITHKPNIVDALGKDWSDVKEGEASIFRPENGHYTLVGRVQMGDWSRIAAAAK
jgi:broad specificity phosphatase PhoE